MNTPKLGSRFCALHTENVAKPQQLDPDSDNQESALPDAEESVVAMIMGKRITRQDSYYQVCIYSMQKNHDL